MTRIVEKVARAVYRHDTDGVLLLDKPAGMTSHQALRAVLKLLGTRKGGHTGSLDPLATGLLPLLVGEATRFSRFLLEADKRYQVEIRLGITTDSDDADGKILTTLPVIQANVDEHAIRAALLPLHGTIMQTPPIFSALKRQGRPLYEYAREGREIEVQPREVHVRAISILAPLPSVEDPILILDVTCSKGTYIRSLARDLGTALGCGAHVRALRRLTHGGFEIGTAVTLDRLRDMTPEDRQSHLLPTDQAIMQIPRCDLEPAQAARLRNGQTVGGTVVGGGGDGAGATGWLRLYAGDRFLGLGERLVDGRIQPRRLLVERNVGAV